MKASDLRKQMQKEYPQAFRSLKWDIPYQLSRLGFFIEIHSVMVWQFILDKRAKLGGFLYRHGLIRKTTCFRWEMDASLGEIE